ncbi:B3/B4 domain-containing protein [Acidaminobacter hydrogenoformans]|uniref:B3/B4 domain-containing protein (DNA/RNA-binding domain of Phe-tRNA-synthetase) n=1 Tax=Acidaminobacter hydrogenoformans DSM 2784 TaxID=1120920 RepID=A0A1G5S005_9FIRM|nr:B3/4 domain-containing protein [Acidaminobacter hydrogenoformans]SCZ79448.1 B3/B4 domain-containing protein (DNA/RNA-binding domain of Phe-tRNA-synthetase) [Acidaminobacter hydrogenoformans DSM 2784]
MSKFIIENQFWEVFPEAEIAVVLAKGINNTKAHAEPMRAELDGLLEKGSEEAQKFLTAEVFSDNKVIAVWRKAYQQFKTKKGVRCSIEALLKRIDKGTGVGPINPLVDIYNSVSLTYGLPCGGEDIDTFVGDLLLTKAVGDEHFMALGDADFDNALPGEIIYKDGEGAVCRCWNWRDGQRTMLTEETVNAFLIIESVDPSRKEDLEAAANALAALTQKYLGGSAEVHLMDSAYWEIVL